MRKYGIDVSEHNGNINWDLVKSSGVEFAIIRSSWGHFQEDLKFRRNIAECNRIGMPYGLYHYSYVSNEAEMVQEANGFIALCKSCNPTYPCYIDMEDADGWKSRMGVSNALNIKVCEYTCDALEKAGFYAGIYANLDWLRNKINSRSLDRFDKWVAQWSQACTYDGTYGMWQYSSDGSVSGSSARTDVNYAYIDYPSVIGGGAKPEEPAPTPPTPQQNEKYVAGYPVCTNTLASQATGGTVHKGDWSAEIEKIFPGTPYPYRLIKNGTFIGFTNDAGIDSDPHVPGSARPASSPIKVGDWVGIRAGARDYNGNAAGGVVKGVIYYTADEIKGDRVVLDIPGICTPFRLSDLFK